MKRLPAGLGRGVSAGGRQGRGRSSATLAARLMGLLLGGTLAACGLDEHHGPKTGPGLDPPFGNPSAQQGGAPESPPGSKSPPADRGASDMGTAGAGTAQAPGSNGMAPGSGGSTAGPIVSADAGPEPTSPGDTVCLGTRYPTQLALYVALEESLSMTEPVDTWAPLSAAFDAWIAAEPSTQLEVRTFAGACDANYAEPSLALAAAAEQRAALDALMSSSTHGVGAATTSALGGVVQRARSFAQTGAGNAAVVLITSSAPGTCGDALATDRASDGLRGSPSVPTYVLALQPRLALDLIAQAGGTGAQYSVANASSEQDLLAGLQAITNEARCRYSLSEDAKQYAPDKLALEVNVGGHVTRVTRVDGAEQCASVEHGFYYDDSVSPRFAIACPQTCALGGTVEILTGC